MIFGIEDIRWNNYLSRMPLKNQDIYFTSQYYKLYGKEKNSIPEIFVYKDEKGNLGFYPFIKRLVEWKGLEEPYYDIETAYGYGGPLVSTNNLDFIYQFESEFLRYCEEERIIAEFIRFHPLIKNENIMKEKIQIIHNRFTVELDLTCDIQDIWMYQISSQNRNTIRKCYKNGLHVRQSKNYDNFIEIYYETMKHVEADEFYYFDKEYFNMLCMDKSYILLEVIYQEKVIASAIFIGYGEYFHYHLSGSRREYLNLAPNNILLWEAIMFAKQKGYKKMHFGGGRSDSHKDSLFLFKKHFSKSVNDFYIGKRIHNSKIYNYLIEEWEKEHKERAQILLQYRSK